MGFLAGAAGKDTVGRNRAHDEFGSEEAPHHVDEDWVLGDLREDLSLAEKVPDAALAVEALVLFGLPLEMGNSWRLDIGAVEDFLARQVDGVLVE